MPWEETPKMTQEKQSIMATGPHDRVPHTPRVPKERPECAGVGEAAPAIHIQITEPWPSRLQIICMAQAGVFLSPQTGPSTFRSSDRVSSAVRAAVDQGNDSGPQTAAIGMHSWGWSCVRTSICPSRKMLGNCSHGKP